MPHTAIYYMPGGALYAVQTCQIILALRCVVFSCVSEKSGMQAVKWLILYTVWLKNVCGDILHLTVVTFMYVYLVIICTTTIKLLVPPTFGSCELQKK